jgi:pyruvate ferredoxin oxidoreductase beta subunit/2-oxoisovalerate ferredoxin oxidoreductase beta subunit
MRTVMRALGPRVVVVVVPSCASIISGPYPLVAFAVPMFHAAFEVAAPTAAAISRAMKIKGREDITVVAFAGDGGTFDIGLQSLSGAADRNEDFLYVCLDNEAYMNTGIQVSSATPRFAWTGTSPSGNPKAKKKIMEIMAAHRIPYAATASVSHPQDLERKVKKAVGLSGTRFIHLLCPCPTGWRFQEGYTPLVARAAVETRVFPLYEIEHGVRYTINYQPRGLPVERYLNIQGRFNHLREEQMEEIQREVDLEWELLVHRASVGI